jgi:hypothetical protein
VRLDFGLSPRRTEVPRSITGTLSRRRTSRIAALFAAPAAALCLLSGCGAGQISQAAEQVAPVPGVEVDSTHGLVSLRNVQVKYNSPEGYPAGATAPLSLYITNNDPAKPLVLRSVTAYTKQGGPEVGKVVLIGGTPDIGAFPGEPSASASDSSSPSAIPSGSPSRRPAASRSAAPAASASAGPSEEPTESPSATPAPSASGAAPTLTIPGNGYARLDPDHGAHLAITELTEALRPGSSVFVTFTFEGEDPVEAPVPFGTPLSPLPRATPSGAGGNEESGGGHG